MLYQHILGVLIIRQKSCVGFNVYCLVVSGNVCSRLNFLHAAAYYWHCGRIECMVLSTAAVSCGSQSVLSTMDHIYKSQNTTEYRSTQPETGETRGNPGLGRSRDDKKWAVFDSYSSRSGEIFFNEIYKSSKQINSQKTSQSILFMCRAKFGTNQLKSMKTPSMFSKIYRYFWRFSTTGKAASKLHLGVSICKWWFTRNLLSLVLNNMAIAIINS